MFIRFQISTSLQCILKGLTTFLVALPIQHLRLKPSFFRSLLDRALISPFYQSEC